MDLHKIESFLCLASQLNFTRAAEMRFISQPTMTAHISSIENELGIQLFNISKQDVKLTPAGEVLAKELINKYYAAVEYALAVSQDNRVLKIGYHGPVDWISIPHIIRKFSSKYPDVDISVQIGGYTKLINSMLNLMLDVIILERREVEGNPKIETQFLFQEPICVFASNEHPYAIGEAFSLSDFQKERFILLDETYLPKGSRRVQNYLKVAGISDILYVSNYEEAMALVAAGNGVVLHPASFIYEDAVVQIPLKDKLYNDFVLAWNKDNNNPSIVLFRRIIEQHFQCAPDSSDLPL